MSQDEDWVLLAYRLPRVPSTPRSAAWRKLNRLGVAQLGTLAGPPLDTTARAAIMTRMTASIAAGYDAVADEAAAARTADQLTTGRPPA